MKRILAGVVVVMTLTGGAVQEPFQEALALGAAVEDSCDVSFWHIAATTDSHGNGAGVKHVALTGDDKAAASYYRKKNSTELTERARRDAHQGALALLTSGAPSRSHP